MYDMQSLFTGKDRRRFNFANNYGILKKSTVFTSGVFLKKRLIFLVFFVFVVLRKHKKSVFM